MNATVVPPAGEGIVGDRETRWGPSSSTLVVAIVVLAVAVSIGSALYQLLAQHELHRGLGYDDGVWFGTAVRMAQGYLPYRDFVLDQPPGVPLLMYPFGLLARSIGTADAFAAARFVAPVFEAVSVVAVGWILRRRGPLAVLVGCGFAAAYPAAVLDQRTVMLEPFCATFCLLGLAVAFSGDRLATGARRFAVAGALFGLAGCCKAFAVLPFVVVVAVLATTRRRGMLPFVGGAAVVFGVVCGPFAALDPSAFLHQIVSVQLVRSQIVDPSRYVRLFSLIDVVPPRPGPLTPATTESTVVVLLVVLAVVVLAAYALTRRSAGSSPSVATSTGPDASLGTGDGPLRGDGAAAGGHPRAEGPSGRRFLHSGSGGRASRLGWSGVSPLDVTAFGAVVVTGYGLLTPSAYYTHYAAFLGPFLGLFLGLVAGRIVVALRSAGPVGPALVTVAALAALAGLSAGTVHAVALARAAGSNPAYYRVVQALVPAGDCVVSDDAPTLLLADRFVSNRPGCSPIVDTFGTTISADGGLAPSSPAVDATAAVAVWRRALAGADYLALTNGFTSRRIPWQSPLLRAYERSHFRIIRRYLGLIVLVRRS